MGSFLRLKKSIRNPDAISVFSRPKLPRNAITTAKDSASNSNGYTRLQPRLFRLTKAGKVAVKAADKAYDRLMPLASNKVTVSSGGFVHARLVTFGFVVACLASVSVVPLS